MIGNKDCQIIVVSVVLLFGPVIGIFTTDIFLEDSHLYSDSLDAITRFPDDTTTAPETTTVADTTLPYHLTTIVPEVQNIGKRTNRTVRIRGQATRRPRRTTLSTRALITWTAKFRPLPEFCVDLMPVLYHEVLPGDPPNVVELEWKTPELMTVYIVGSPFTRSCGFLMQGRIKNTTIPVGTFPKGHNYIVYDCPPGRANTVIRQNSESYYLHTVNWQRPENVSIENITFVVSVLKPFDVYYQKQFELPPLPERFISEEIPLPKVKRSTVSTRKVNKTKE